MGPEVSTKSRSSEPRGVYILNQDNDVFLIMCISKRLSYVNVISQLHLDISTSPSSCYYKYHAGTSCPELFAN